MKPGTLIAFASLALSSYTSAKNVISFDFDVSKGSTFKDAAKHKRAALVKRDNADGSVDLVLENQSNFYSIDIEVGTPGQNVTVLLDTGSSDLWVTGSDNSYCSSSSSSDSTSFDTAVKGFRKLDGAPHPRLVGNRKRDEFDTTIEISYLGTATASAPSSTDTDVSSGSSGSSGSSSSSTIDCSEYGTFDKSSSSTYESNNTEFYIIYGDDSFSYGTWGYDTVSFSGTTVENLSFAVANETNSSVGVLGIGLEGLETTYSGTNTGANKYTYANLPTKLVQDGIINKRVYSLYLNSADSTSGTILFGGVDHEKYNGTLTTVPMINTLKSSGYTETIKIQITLSGVGVESSDGNTTLDTNNYAALLDSGTTLTYMPDDMITAIANAVGATYSSSLGYYMFSCSSGSSYNIVYDFQGKLISVSLSDLAIQVSSRSSQCVLGLFSSGDEEIILGDTFLQSAYVVYNLDDLEVSLAQVNYSDEEDIEVISSTVPSAVSAAQYSATWSASEATAATTGNIFTNSDTNAAVSENSSASLNGGSSATGASSSTSASASGSKSSSSSKTSATSTASGTSGTSEKSAASYSSSSPGVLSILSLVFLCIGFSFTLF